MPFNIQDLGRPDVTQFQITLPEGVTLIEIAYDTPGGIVKLRRGLDLLLALDDIDASRLGYVGHDYGAMHGIALAGVDTRVKAYVLTTPTGSCHDWQTYFSPLRINELEEYRQRSPTLDRLTYANHVTGAQLFFQFSQDDRFVSKESAKALFATTSGPKQMKMYDVLHDLE